jgi:hypothetical protein
MRLTRSKHHYAVRNASKNEWNIRKQKFAQSILENNNRDFRDGVRKLRHSNKGLSNVVDLASTDDEIAHVF